MAQDSAWGSAVLGAMPGALQTAHSGGAHPAVPWPGTCSGALTFPAPAVRCWVHCTGRHSNSSTCKFPVVHPRCWTLGLPLQLGMSRAFPQGSRKVLGTSWGIKALSQGSALGKFNLLALRASHFPLVMRMLSWVGSPAAVPHPPRGVDADRACAAAHPPAHQLIPHRDSPAHRAA